jgi:hypothetical protein
MPELNGTEFKMLFLPSRKNTLLRFICYKFIVSNEAEESYSCFSENRVNVPNTLAG